MIKRLNKINKQLINYSLGNFDTQLRVSGKFDRIDALMANLNMLGEELRAITVSRDFFNNIFNSSWDMVFVLDKKGLVKSVNQTATHHLKRDEASFSNIQIDTIFNKGEKPFYRVINKKLKKGGDPIQFESSVKIEDEAPRPVRCTCSFLLNKQNRPEGYLLVIKDLSQLKAYEQLLRTTEEKYQRLFQESGDAIFITNAAGMLEDLNLAGYRLFGLKPGEALSTSLFSLFRQKKTAERFRKLIGSRGGVSGFEASMAGPGTEKRDCLISANLVRKEGETGGGIQGIIKDISLQRQTEKRIVHTIIQTQEKERERVARDIHDSVGQQISAIKFYIGTVLARTKQGKEHEVLLKSNETLLQVLSDIRNICFNLMPRTLETHGLAESVRELTRQLRVSDDIRFLFNCDAGFPRAPQAVEFAVFRVIQEFINNSLKHGQPKHIQISLKKAKNGMRVLLSDDGVGFNLQEVTKKRGMGLSNIRSRIESFDGELIVRSAENKGVQYNIFIPLNSEEGE